MHYLSKNTVFQWFRTLRILKSTGYLRPELVYENRDAVLGLTNDLWRWNREKYRAVFCAVLLVKLV